MNTSLEPRKRTLDLTPLSPQPGDADCWTLADTAHAGERDAFNSWRQPERIRPESAKASVVDGKLVHEFPPLSLTVLEIRCKDGQ